MALTPQQEADALRLVLTAMSSSNGQLPMADFIASTSVAQLAAAHPGAGAEHETVLKGVAARNTALYEKLHAALSDQNPSPNDASITRGQDVANQLRDAFTGLSVLFDDVFNEGSWGGEPPHPRGEALVQMDPA